LLIALHYTFEYLIIIIKGSTPECSSSSSEWSVIVS